VLPDDGTWKPKHVGAIYKLKINNINKIGAFVGLFYIYDIMNGARIKTTLISNALSCMLLYLHDG
jgi:hypothetical protein